MKCIEAQKLIRPYLNKSLDPRILPEFLDHVEHCQECYEELEINLAINYTFESFKNDDDGRSENYDFKNLTRDTLRASHREIREHKLQTILTWGISGIVAIFVCVWTISALGDKFINILKDLQPTYEAPDSVYENAGEYNPVLRPAGRPAAAEGESEEAVPGTEAEETVYETVPETEAGETVYETVPGTEAEETVYETVPETDADETANEPGSEAVSESVSEADSEKDRRESVSASMHK